MTMSRFAEAILLLLLALGAIWGAYQVPPAPAGETWAGIVPMGAAILLLILALWMGLNALGASTQGNGLPIDEGEAKTSDNSGTLHVLVLFAVALVYQQSLRWFGYLLPTALVAPIVLSLFGVRNWKGLVLSVFICPLVFHIIFFELLGVFPPFGEVFDLLDFLKG